MTWTFSRQGLWHSPRLSSLTRGMVCWEPVWCVCAHKFDGYIKSHLLSDQAYMSKSDDKRETEIETDGEFPNMRDGQCVLFRSPWLTVHLPLKVLENSERLRPDCFSGEVSKESRVPPFLSLLPSFHLKFHRGLEIDSCCVRVKSMFSEKLITPSGNYVSHPQVLEHSASDCIRSFKRLYPKFQTVPDCVKMAGKIIGCSLPCAFLRTAKNIADFIIF